MPHDHPDCRKRAMEMDAHLPYLKSAAAAGAVMSETGSLLRLHHHHSQSSLDRLHPNRRRI